MEKKKLILLSTFLVLATNICFGHPSKVDFWGIERHVIGLFISIVAIIIVLAVYTIVGLRRTTRAKTISDYFFYDKQVDLSNYFNTTVGYSFQVVVTIYFIFWGFKYGIGITAYALLWLLGFLLFQWSSKKLIAFAESNETLHSFLSNKYDSKWIKKLTAFCTIFGLLGALLIEVNYTTDIVTSLSVSKVSIPQWSILFTFLLLITWLYVQYGGYKATVNNARIQLPLIYICICILFLYITLLGFTSGFNKEGFIFGLIISLLWLIVFIARRRTLKSGNKDIATKVSFIAFIINTLLLMILVLIYKINNTNVNIINDLPYGFSLEGFAKQDKIVFFGFFVLNLSWQFFDMSAWQRLSSLNLSNLTPEEKHIRIKSAIGETKWESPITWMFAIMLGIGLRYSGFFTSAEDAGNAFFSFIQILTDNDLSLLIGGIGTYIVMPALVLSFVSIMFSTTDSFLNTITYAWINDISNFKMRDIINQNVEHNLVLRKARTFSLMLVVISSIIFIALVKIFEIDVFVLLNTIYSAQFLITFFSLGALYLTTPTKYKLFAIGTVLLGLIGNFLTAYFCFYKMHNSSETFWADWLYVLPSIVSFIIGIPFLLTIVIENIRKRI